jgi:hypothetical protein
VTEVSPEEIGNWVSTTVLKQNATDVALLSTHSKIVQSAVAHSSSNVEVQIAEEESQEQE